MNFLFRQPLGGAPGGVFQGARITSHSDHGTCAQGVVGLPVPTANEPVPTHPPVALTGAFGKDDAKQRQWQAFVHKGRLDAGTLGDTVELLHTLLLPASQVAVSTSDANSRWQARRLRWA